MDMAIAANENDLRQLHTNIHLPERQIVELCQRYHIRKFYLFGSVLREDFRSDSDVDVLAEFEPTYAPSLTDLLKIERDLSLIFQRAVDFADRESVEEDSNYIRRKNILTSARVIYAR
jgi:hypothetical protein